MAGSCDRSVGLVFLVLAGAMALACSEGQGPATTPDEHPESLASLPGLIVSNPAGPGLATVSTSRGALVDALVYASLPPGSVPDGEQMRFTNLTTGAGATAAVVNGGFDPVPVPASSGDSLRIQLQGRGAPTERVFYAKVPPHRAPRVVRSDPPARHSDVPLNSRILVVFSEPMSAAAVSGAAVYLSRDIVRVPALLAFADSAHLSVVITPDVPLAPGSTYTLYLSEALTDSDGEALAAPVFIRFSTEAPGSGTPGGGVLGCCGALDAIFERTEPYEPGHRHTELILRADGSFTLHYKYPVPERPDEYQDGTYERADSSVSLMFQAEGFTLGPWEAEATLRGEQLTVRFSSFDRALAEGDYSRRPAGGGIAGGTSGRGTLRVLVSASGPDAPRLVHGLLTGDAIRSVIDGEPLADHPTFSIGANDLSLAPGRYLISLQPPANCAPSAPVEVVILPDSTTSAAVSASCSEWAWLSVGLVVSSQTAPDLARATIFTCQGGSCPAYWPGSGVPMPIRVAAGEYVLRFFEPQNNCQEVPSAGVSVSVAQGEMRAVTLTVSCSW